MRCGVQKHFARNKAALTATFEAQPRHVVLFVFGNTNGRLNGEDVDAFKKVTAVYALKPASLVAVFNSASPDPEWRVRRLRRVAGRGLRCVSVCLSVCLLPLDC